MTAVHEPRTAEIERSTVSSEPGRGIVASIHVTARGGDPMQPVERVRAIAGVGLEGDRYALGTGHYSPDPKVDRQITLIAAEEIDRLAADVGIELAPGETRRNVMTRGVDVNALVGRRFRIGSVECQGTRLCEPCAYLEGLLGRPVLEPLVHRAGLRARLLTDGEIALGDEVVALD
ncbi:MAG TPA: MOSC domain-containing protein [Candidatus Limnocylindrales bacterium]|nr:MOSC domain-containing protein [Candidatus Limnocylindrales bacterium]